MPTNLIITLITPWFLVAKISLNSPLERIKRYQRSLVQAKKW